MHVARVSCLCSEWLHHMSFHMSCMLPQMLMQCMADQENARQADQCMSRNGYLSAEKADTPYILTSLRSAWCLADV